MYLVLFELVLDIFSYPLHIFSRGVHTISSTPETSIAILVLQVSVPLMDHEAAFSFQVSHETRHTHLWRYFNEHVYMVGTYFRFDDFNLFPFTKVSQDFPYFGFLLSVEYLPPVLWPKYDMIFAVPTRCVQT